MSKSVKKAEETLKALVKLEQAAWDVLDDVRDKAIDCGMACVQARAELVQACRKQKG